MRLQLKMCFISKRSEIPLLIILVFLLLSNHVVQSNQAEIFPNVEMAEQVTEADSVLVLTCIEVLNPLNLSDGEIKWEVPRITKYKEKAKKRLYETIITNETHLISTMTLKNTEPTDTGIYKCRGRSKEETRYVYVSSHEKIVFMDYLDSTHAPIFKANPGESIQFPFKTTHPNVSISVFQQTTEIRVHPRNEFFEIWNSSSPNENPRWSFNSKFGLTLANTTVFDTAKYYFVGSMPLVNGKRVNIKHSEEIREFLRWSFPLDKLKANNEVSSRVPLIVEGIELEKVGAPGDPVEGSNVVLICTTSSFNFNLLPFPPKWTFIDHYRSIDLLPVQTFPDSTYISSGRPNKDIEIKTERKWEKWSFYKSQLHLHNLTLNTPYKRFKCENNNRTREITLTIKEINNYPVANTVALKKGIAQNLTCNRLSDNVAIQWFKDDEQYLDTVDDNKTASVLPLQGKTNELGIYECRWNNSRGEARHRRFIVSFIFVEETNEITIIVTANFVVILAVGMGLGIKFYLGKKKLENELQKILIGNPTRIDPDEPIEYQVEFLPYDKKWEFPRKRLRLGQELGSGSFGRVVKAEAVGIKDSDEAVTTVAVKMIKPSAKSQDALDALIRELKIMIYLGGNLNVVNLMGACTKTTVKEKILVIIDFCRFGDVKSYLIQRRAKFVNQLNALSNMVRETETVEIDTLANEPIGNDFTENRVAFAVESDVTMNHIIKTSDLISWSLQIARGMEFLASKKVLHGDLAARNVLLADHGVVKVADFGLARQMKDYDYKKKEEDLLPIKWMAIESLTDKIFSSQSDVWSYGIVLWEIFSLGREPYPGIGNGCEFQERIQNGYRMGKPEYSPNYLGEIMKICWKSDPKERPTFFQLAEMIKSYIESIFSMDYSN